MHQIFSYVIWIWIDKTSLKVSVVMKECGNFNSLSLVQYSTQKKLSNAKIHHLTAVFLSYYLNIQALLWEQQIYPEK